MRVPLEWLHEYCRPPLQTTALAQRLTMTGTKVEAIHSHGVKAHEHFVVGKVLEARSHPTADRLTVCMVDVGEDSATEIVCGAPNVAAGQTVAVARPGAVMPDGSRLGTARLRGIDSHGMILAEDELGIGTDHTGILVLAEDHEGPAPGTPLQTVLPISTEVLELEVTSNRPDCLGVFGVAREVRAATGAELAPAPWSADPGNQGPVEEAAVRVECPELCPRFTARVFEDVRIGPSPPWLKARLMACGQRPISNVVDITNYVMLLTGQPLHAFDLDRVAGAALTVRRARRGEEVQTLDGQIRVLDERMVVIDDAEGPTSIAGVMGGMRSEVSPDTRRVLMEVASWDGPAIHHASWSLGLQSEASLRFEKQLQPEQALEAQAVATRLMAELCGATLRPGTIDVGGPGPEPVRISLRQRRVRGLLGADIPRERCREILTSLEFSVADAPAGLDVCPPAFRRGDVSREADVIEEVARLDGLEKLPATLPSRHGAAGRLAPRQAQRRRALDALVGLGLDEVVGWSFVGPDAVERLRVRDGEAVVLANPLSAEQSRLRTTLLASLLDVAARNHVRGVRDLRLFEAGAVYLPRAGEPQPREPDHIAVLLSGSVRPSTWRDPRPPAADFFAAKGVLEALLDRLEAPLDVQPAADPFLHPGRAATILIAGAPAGWLGEIHPLVAASWGLEPTLAGFELDLDVVPVPAIRQYEGLPTHPGIEVDLAVVVGEDVTAGEVVSVARRSGGPLLAGVEVLDVYRDVERIGAGNVSLALRLTFRAPDRTLVSVEAAEGREAVSAALAQQFGGRIRAG